MKKALSIVLTFIISTGYAQQGFNIGAATGLNTVWITHQDDYGQVGIEHTLDYGVAPALTLGYNFTDNLGLQLDLIYSFQGAKYQQTLKGGTLNRLVELNYFKIPVYFKYASTISGAKNVKFFIMGGPQIDLLQSATIIANYIDAPFVGENEKYRFESVDVELAGEGGVYIYASKNLYFTLGARFDYGLTDMNAPGSRTDPYSPGYNVTAGLLLGISYWFSKK